MLPPISAETVAAHPDIRPVVLQLLHNRGLKEGADIQKFLASELEPELVLAYAPDDRARFYDPFLFRDMAAAVDMIIGHIKAGRRIVVYGDYDADGVTSSVVLLEALRLLHAAAEVYLPDRVSEGYGLNKAAIKQIAAQGVKLIITVDNGIRNRAEVEYAKQLGLDVIITDHHVLPEDPKDYPDCLRIDPADPADPYPWRYLAGVGVAFKLVCALLAKADLPPRQKQLISEKCLDLVAVGTVSDMVSLLGENRLLVKRGLEILNENRRLGLNELLKLAKVAPGRPLETWNIGWQIGPRLNAASRLAHANTAFGLLTTADADEAKELAAELNQRNISRQRITDEIMAQAEEQINQADLPDIIIAVAAPDQIWNEGVIGLVAGRLTEKYYRPALVISRLVEEAEFDPELKKLVPKRLAFKGSGRSIEELNLIQAIESCSEELHKYGGHPMACGFFIQGEDKLRAFQDKISAAARKILSGQDLRPKLKIEAELAFGEITLEAAEAIAALGPFGQDNPQPRLAAFRLRLDDVVFMGSDRQHVKLRLSSLDQLTGRVSSFWAVAFGAADAYGQLEIGSYVDIVYYLEINDFNGRREPQLKLVDLRPASEA